MSYTYSNNDYLRRHFGYNPESTIIPPLSEIYIKSFSKFLQLDENPLNRKLIGLESSFRSIFPLEIKRTESTRQKKRNNANQLKDIYYYSHYVVHPPLHSEEECRLKGLSYLCSVYIVTYKYSVRGDKNITEFNQRQLERNANILEKSIFVFPIKGIPFMTKKGTFLINGIERAIVSQLQRCPGIYYHRNNISRSSEVKIIPYYGTNLQLEQNLSERCYVRIGGKRRIPLHTFLLSLGIPYHEIISLIYNPFKMWNLIKNKSSVNFNLKNILYGTITKNIKDLNTGEIILSKKQRIDYHTFQLLLNSSFSNFYNNDYFNIMGNRESLNSKNNDKNQPNLDRFAKENIYYYFPPQDSLSYRRKIAESIKVHAANSLMKELSESIDRYYRDPLYFNLSIQGRTQINQTLEIHEYEHMILTKMDIFSLVSYIYTRNKNENDQDSVYHIQNRKVRLPGEIFNFLIYKSMLNIKQKKEYSGKNFINKYTPFYINNIMPSFLSERIRGVLDPFTRLSMSAKSAFINNYIFHKIYQFSHINEKLYQLILLSCKKDIEYFITGSNLSQLLDQINPLSSITHIRRVSLLGPEGLQRDNVSMDTRDVQSSFFGRICPIETPEGKSVGIVNSLTIYSKINPYGDILTPYRKVDNGYLTSQVHYLEARIENSYYIALSSEVLDISNKLANALIYCRHEGEYKYVDVKLVNYIDVSSKKILSLSSSLIPFIEHNDGNRALMGSNMQRQAVVNYVRENPICGTGMELMATAHEVENLNDFHSIASIDSKHLLTSHHSANVHPMSIEHSISNALEARKNNPYINIISVIDQGMFDHNLANLPSTFRIFKKYEKNNQKGYEHHIPQLNNFSNRQNSAMMIDHASTIMGDVSIGHNLLIGFTSMNGYSFEDSIVISDRLLKDDLFSSFHTKEFIAFDWDTFQTKERITKNIPYVSHKILSNLDSTGVIRTGARLRGGDIIIGKILVDRKEKSVLSERDRFLQQILAADTIETDYIKDTSERVPVDLEGTVLDVKKFFFSDVNIPELLPRKNKEEMIFNYISYRFKLFIIKNYLYKKLGQIIANIYMSKLTKHFDNHFEFMVKGLDDLRIASNKQKFYVYPWIPLMFMYINSLDENLKNLFIRQARGKKLFGFVEKNNARVINWSESKYLHFLLNGFIVEGNSIKNDINKLIIIYYTICKNLKINWLKNHFAGLQKTIYSETSHLPIKLVKILIGYKHKLKSGDKMTGRHGNKGVVSQVLPMAEMPYLSDGTPLDIILNPIGISSRMNLGQVFEVYFGMSGLFIGKKLYNLLKANSLDSSYQDVKQTLLHLYGQGTKEYSIISKLSSIDLKILSLKLSRSALISTTSFDGASSRDNDDQMEISNVNYNSQSIILDSKSGERFDRHITVGLMYILKLNHLVDEKIHARFTGPYNRVTEQPLGGKSLEGGQRFGEMEVWALQAYGAAYTLFDMLTVKSDLKSRLNYNKKDKRSSDYIDKKKQSLTDFPEAFNVLLRELWCLGLNIKLNN